MRRDFAETTALRTAMWHGGWFPVPVWEHTKGPAFCNWSGYRFDPNDPEPLVPRGFNLAGEPTRAAHWGTGALTRRIAAFDIDTDDAAKAHAIRVAFQMGAGEEAGCVRRRANSPRLMLFYATGPDVPEVSASFGEKPIQIELFANHGGRQVMVYGVHPSGAPLEYEGDGPADIAVADLPTLSRADLERAIQAALRAAGLPIPPNVLIGAKRRSVRKQPTLNAAVDELAETMHAIATGASVHNAANTMADLLVFQMRMDDEQAAAVLAAFAGMAARLNPDHGDRYAEMMRKAASKAAWYVDRAEAEPDVDGVLDPVKVGFWRHAREMQMRRAWALLPDDMRADFARSLIQAYSKGAEHAL